MKIIFELFLDALQIDYTHQFATNLYGPKGLGTGLGCLGVPGGRT